MIMIAPTLTTRARAAVARLWQYEPVRTVLAPIILAAVVAGLVRAGVDGSLAFGIATVVLGGLGFTAQEIARAKVVPVPKSKGDVADTITAARVVLAQHLGEQGTEIADQIVATAREYVGQHRKR